MSTDRLAQENRRLRSQLDDLLRRARENEDKLNRVQSLELKLIGAPGLAEIVDLLSRDLPRISRLDHVGILLEDITGEVGLALAEAGIAPSPGHVELNPPGRLPLRSYVGPYDPRLHAQRCGGRDDLASLAIIPLRRGEQPLGALVLGSRNPQRYLAGLDTYFLERLAAITAVCVENALNLRRLRELGLTDALTGLRNRRYFDEQLPLECARAQRDGGVLACLFVDIDHFKAINDELGHPVGDRVIREVAQRIASHVRPFDMLARYGGEEFVVLLTRLEFGAVLEVAERIRAAVAGRPVVLDEGLEQPVTVSLGAAQCAVVQGDAPGPAFSGRALLEAADQALLRAKQEGRNRVVIGQSFTTRARQGVRERGEGYGRSRGRPG
jgi:two-component system, cell cycle response regulator